MKRKGKILIALLATALLLCIAIVTLSACGDRDGANSTHQHTFAESWSKNEDGHWHAATCEHTTEKSDSAAHNFEWEDITVATCTQKGLKKGTCGVCQYETYQPTEMLSHILVPSWSWTSGTITATLNMTCSKCGNVIEAVPATITSITDSDQCADFTLYTASAEYAGQTYTEQKRIETYSYHTYVLSEWKWAADMSSAAMEMICNKCNSATLTVGANVTGVEGSDECSDYVTYTATAAYGGETFTDAQKVETSSHHAYAFSQWKWDDDFLGAIAVFVCDRDDSHVFETERIASVVSGHADPDCVTDGYDDYLVSYVFDGRTYEGSQHKTISKLDHDFNTPWLHDAQNHWHKCSRCDVTDAQIAHTMDGKYVCVECGYTTSTSTSEFTFVATQNNAWKVTKYNGNQSSVIIPAAYDGKDIVEIGNSAFENNSTLTSVVILSTVTSIGDRAFYGCSALRTLTIGDNVASIGASAFEGCPINTVTYPASAIESVPKGSLTQVTVTKGDIGDEAFANLGLQIVTIGEGIQTIGDSVFKDCVSLHTVNWNATRCQDVGGEIVADPYNRTINYIFCGCTSFATLNVGANVQYFPGYTFYECYYITKVNFLGTLKQWCSIELGKYYNAINSSASPLYVSNSPDSGNSDDDKAKLYLNGELLTEVSGLDGLETITDYAFYGLTDLISVTIPDSVTNVGRETFNRCENVKTLTIGKGVQSMFQWTSSNSKLEKVYYTGTLRQWCEIDSPYSSPNCLSARQPDYGVIRLYIQNQPVTEVSGLDGLETIPAYAFYGQTALTSVTLPDSLQTIGNYAFTGCGITSVTIPGNVTNIERNAFQDCENLLSVDLVCAEQANIGLYAFFGCTSLKTVIIEKNVQSLDRYAFAGSENLKDVFFEGTKQEWTDRSFSKAFTGYEKLDVKYYYYRDDYPYENSSPVVGEYYWHWDEDLHIPEVWEKQY